MLLAGDVGGTKTVLALFESGVGHVEKVRERVFASRDFPSLEAMILEFDKGGDRDVEAACFGVPGAVVDGECRTTNLPWTIREGALADICKTKRVRLINDLQAAGFGMLHLPASELVVLHPGLPGKARGNIGVIAAGTGLGEGLLAWTGDEHLPIASEGGHASFSPRSDVEIDLLRFLQRRVDGGHVSWERVVSGAGLGHIYDFLKERGVHEESEHVAAKLKTQDKAAVVGVEAVNNTDRLCGAAAELFSSLYGAEAGNVALKFLATGGVLVGGGIAPKLLPVLQRGGFARAFADKGRFSGLLKNVTVQVSLNEKAALLGAAQWAAEKL